jgi:hypothetical protein
MKKIHRALAGGQKTKPMNRLAWNLPKLPE